MTKDKIRIRLAKLDGYMEIQRCTRRLRPKEDGVEWMGTKDRPSINYSRTYEILPEYTSDRNALFRLLEKLSIERMDRFCERLMTAYLWPADARLREMLPRVLVCSTPMLAEGLALMLFEEVRP